jgi:hypothetical protein
LVAAIYRDIVLGSCRPDLIPPGRWVTAPDRPLAFSQQLAVNCIMREHGDGQPGAFAVNGPPGTGKTTMLRDVVAAVVVQRAIKLVNLPSPEHPFAGEPMTWETPSWTHLVCPLKPELTGDEIVVARPPRKSTTSPRPPGRSRAKVPGR